MYYNEDVSKVLLKLETDEKGLTNNEAIKRLNENGRNILVTNKKESILNLFFKELISPIEIILIVTAIISIFIGEIVDGLIILFIVLIDVLMGTYQENKAIKSAKSLSNMLKMKSKVLRDGKKCEIDSEEIVVGDILVVDSGTKLPADARIISANNLQVDESVLTGESMTVTKYSKTLDTKTILAERENMLYAGTNIITGRAIAVVTATGSKTEIGKIAQMVSEVKKEKTPLTIRMEKFVKQIGILIIILSILSAIILFLKGYTWNSVLLSVVALAVSAMPEGMSLAFTMALTIASNKMSKKNVIVKNLNAVEALGSCTTIASDKTGTFTVDEQTARKIVLSSGEEIEVTGTGYNGEGKVVINDEKLYPPTIDIIKLCSLNNEGHFEKEKGGYIYYGDSIDVAFLVLKEKLDVNINFKIEDRIPYESEKKYSAVFYKKEEQLYCTIKGSLEKVMSLSKPNKLMIEENKRLSKEGYRVIAVANGKVNGTSEKDIEDLDILGLVAFIDPIRSEVKNAIKTCKTAGINVVMITGDHPLTSLAIAKELELASTIDEVVTGEMIDNAYQKGEKYFCEFIKDKKVFSRVTPTNKLNIVEAMKKNGEFVAVTGDGVNDASAIKAANIGIAMGSGTDVAKDTADMIIIDDNFKSIVSGIIEGRNAYANIRKIAIFLLSCGFAEIMFFLIAVILGYELPLVALQLLWINIVTDGLQDISLSFETESKNIMKEKPRNTKESLFNKELIIQVLIYGITITIMVFSLWKRLIDSGIQLEYARGIILMLMVFIQNIHVLNCRSEKVSICKMTLFSNPFVIFTILSSIVLQIVIAKIPVLSDILNIQVIPNDVITKLFFYSLIIILVSEVYKFIYKKQNKKDN